MKFTSNGDKKVFTIFENDESPVTKKRYKRPKIKNKAPNCVQKNIR
jgi:hypothetical protein